MWIFLGNEEVRERGDEEVELARRRNNKVRGFTQFLTHKSTLLGTYIKAQFSQPRTNLLSKLLIVWVGVTLSNSYAESPDKGCDGVQEFECWTSSNKIKVFNSEWHRARPNPTPGIRNPGIFGRLGSGRWDLDLLVNDLDPKEEAEPRHHELIRAHYKIFLYGDPKQFCDIVPLPARYGPHDYHDCVSL